MGNRCGQLDLPPAGMDKTNRVPGRRRGDLDRNQGLRTGLIRSEPAIHCLNANPVLTGKLLGGKTGPAESFNQ